MRNLRIDLEYDGSSFAGWAKQPRLPTIEASLESVLSRILQQEVRLQVAGRTDAGVHARGQVVSLRTHRQIDPTRLRRSANQLLPTGIAIREVTPVSYSFCARRSALARHYSYSILNRQYPSVFARQFTYYYPGALDRRRLQEAAGLIQGHHDFTAFTPTVTEHSFFQREVSVSEWRFEGDLMVYAIGANSFLRNMVRVVVGTMIEVARGRRTLENLSSLLAGAERPSAGKTAPPQGLCLERVDY